MDSHAGCSALLSNAPRRWGHQFCVSVVTLGGNALASNATLAQSAARGAPRDASRPGGMTQMRRAASALLGRAGRGRESLAGWRECPETRTRRHLATAAAPDARQPGALPVCLAAGRVLCVCVLRPYRCLLTRPRRCSLLGCAAVAHQAGGGHPGVAHRAAAAGRAGACRSSREVRAAELWLFWRTPWVWSHRHSCPERPCATSPQVGGAFPPPVGPPVVCAPPGGGRGRRVAAPPRPQNCAHRR
jgi:hypothetical protein